MSTKSKQTGRIRISPEVYMTVNPGGTSGPWIDYHIDDEAFLSIRLHRMDTLRDLRDAIDGVLERAGGAS